MKIILILITSLIGIVTFSSCEKLVDTTWVYYNETKCADPWGSNENTPEKEKIKMIEKYFDDKGIKIFKIEIPTDGTVEACKSCFCKIGKRIKCKIKESDAETMKNEEFYQ